MDKFRSSLDGAFAKGGTQSKESSSSTRKKTFAPKIPQRRTQVKKEETEPICEESKPLTREGQKSQKPRQKKEFIQLQGGLFGQGIAAKPKTKSSSVSVSSEVCSIPAIKKTIKKELKKKKQDDDDDYNDQDWDDVDDQIPLITVPTVPSASRKSSSLTNLKPVMKDTKEKKIKTECPDEGYSNEASDTTETDGFSLTDDDSLFLMQLPDGVINSLGKNSKDKSSDVALEDTNDDNDNQTQPVALDEPHGYIGKLQVLKSGRIRLLIGSVEYSMECHKNNFLQKLVLMNDEELTVLGNVKHTLACVETSAKTVKELNYSNENILLIK